MTTSSSVPPTSEPWPDAANYPPPAVAADAATGPTEWPSAAPLPPAGAERERPAETLFPPVALPPVGPKGRASWAGRLRTLPARTWRGRPDDARWVRPAFLGLLLATAVLYFWNLTASGWANSFYSAAVQAGSVSWKAMFFGSSDSANFITVDKPPLSLWPMALSARIFGLSSFSVLAPQVLMGVGTVAAVYATVRRRFSALGGLVAGAALALTPVAALMFRFNNPDAALVLLLTLAAYGIVRATETASTRWILFVGTMLGLAFLAKTLQAFLVLPGFALVYLVCAPTSLRRRFLQLLYGTVAMVVAGGWWVAIVELMPASARPYIGGSQDNSFLSLTFGYNGFGRITGDETGSVGGGGGGRMGGGGGGGMWGSTGITRLFDGDIGGQIAWLMPAALILLVFGLWATRRYPRTDSARIGFLVWGGWLLSTALTFSFMSGIFHQYYTVALVPAVAALVGMGVDGLWKVHHRLPYAAVLAVTLLVTAWWAHQLLGRSTDFVPWLRNAVLVVGVLAALGLLFAGRIAGLTGRRIATVAGLTALAAGLAGPAAYALDTVSTGHSGSIVTAGPAVQSGGGFGGRGGFPGGGGGGGGGGRMGGQNGTFPGFPGGGQNGSQNGGTTNGMPNFPGGTGTGGNGGTMPNFPGGTGTGTNPGTGTGGTNTFPGFPGGTTGEDGRGGFGGMGGGGMGGLLNGALVSSEVADLLKQDADKYTWVAAAVGSQNQASYQLASGEPVMALGGFNGSDPSLSLDGFKQLVKEGKVHWFIGGSGMGGGSMGGSNYSSEIASWVESTYTAKTVGSTTMYDLTATPKSSS
ncbi:ArnT family glycosyltransferase [Kitasatospora phosalacinea]|uniref:ArnT family glycosyltransferase n=1 Tax=Kitasatospora phosalacinea TaxID=2065 RepID=UPI0036602EE5